MTTFLRDAAPDRLLRAVAANHRQWMVRLARAAGGGAYREGGTTWAYAPGPAAQVEIPFPRMPANEAGERIDAILRFCRDRPLRQVGCWSLVPARPRDLGALLVARGFEWGWRPHWMWLDLEKLPAEPPPPPGVLVEPVEDGAAWDVEDLPYDSPEGAACLQVAARVRPRRVWRFAAWRDGRPVGHSALHLTAGRLGVAGIFNCGVVPDARRQGIGAAVTHAACQQARQMGCRHALLNATPMGEPVYRRLGFESLGWGQTWWLHREALESPPSAGEVAFAEAVGRGDTAALAALRAPDDLDAPLASGMTPMGIAVETGRPASAEWLARHGATLDVVSAWDLGWQNRVREMLARSPELARARRGTGQATPLHVAAERGDADLARALLAADPDLEAKDARFQSTPLGWARHLGRAEIVALIERHRPNG